MTGVQTCALPIFPEQVQAWMQEAALEAAYSERLESLEDGKQAVERCHKEGITVVEWSEEETQKLKEATKPVYEKYEAELTPGLINRVKYMH